MSSDLSFLAAFDESVALPYFEGNPLPRYAWQRSFVTEDILPLVGCAGDPTFLKLQGKSSGGQQERPGALLNEYPFQYSLGSYLADVSFHLNDIINRLDSAGLPSGVLRAVHVRVEAICDLVLNRISIIAAAAQFDGAAAS